MASPFLPKLLSFERLVITTHSRPDGDALGSQIALGLLLERLGKTVSMINCDAPPPNLEWLPSADRVEVYDGSLDQVQRITEADAIVLVDTNSENRIGGLARAVRDSPASKVVIDHHPRPEPWFDHSYVRETASSTGELVYELILQVEGAVPPGDSIDFELEYTRRYERAGVDTEAAEKQILDHEIATLLYTAIMTDTGSFRYSNVGPTVHRITADILERGKIVPDDIHSNLFDTKSFSALRLTGRALERITLKYDGLVGYMVIPRQLMADAGADRGDTEGLVNHILSVDGVRVAVFFQETDKGTKVSFRSKGDLYVDRWAQAFGGGGHRNASGAFVKGKLGAVVEKVLEAAPRFIAVPNEQHSPFSEDDQSYLAELLKQKSK